MACCALQPLIMNFWFEYILIFYYLTRARDTMKEQTKGKFNYEIYHKKAHRHIYRHKRRSWLWWMDWRKKKQKRQMQSKPNKQDQFKLLAVQLLGFLASISLLTCNLLNRWSHFYVCMQHIFRSSDLFSVFVIPFIRISYLSVSDNKKKKKMKNGNVKSATAISGSIDIQIHTHTHHKSVTATNINF